MAHVAYARYLFLICISICCCEGVQQDKVDHANCVTAYKNCREHKSCRLSYRNIGSKCTVIEGRCSAIMKHLPACDKIMKDIFTHGFPKTRCVCDKDTAKCQDIQRKIYQNPCFASIRHLKERNLFPHDVSATTVAQVHTKSTTTAQRTTPKNEEKQRANSLDRSTTSVKETTTTVLTIDGRKDEYNKDYTMKILDQDKTDYKLLTIIFATLLGLFILLVAAFFAWSGIKNIVYTQGKKVSKERPGSLQKGDEKLCSNNNVSKD